MAQDGGFWFTVVLDVNLNPIAQIYLIDIGYFRAFGR